MIKSMQILCLRDCMRIVRISGTCPWGFTVVDNVAPAFKSILQWNYSFLSPVGTNLWSGRRYELDRCFGIFLSKLEDSWLGPLKYVLLGERLNCRRLESAHKKLLRRLKFECKVDVGKNLIRVLLGGLKRGCKVEEHMQLCFNKGCYIGMVGSKMPSMGRNGVETELAYRRMCEALKELGEDSVDREPTILVLDCEVQMLPWENIPVLRYQEVYRMPSVISIATTLDHQKQLERLRLPIFLQIDPRDSFYLLNPGGDLGSTQALFEHWFRTTQNLEGRAGSAPTAAELAVALESHDLYIYAGQGSGARYISQEDISKLEKCGAALLMGCCSGSLRFKGCYSPQGTALSYLLAGAPVVVANLWDVGSGDLDRFGKAMLEAWWDEGYPLHHFGSFRGRACDECRARFLNGASVVCYGVPTSITRRKIGSRSHGTEKEL